MIPIMENWLRCNEHTVKAIAAVVATLFALFQYYGHIKEVQVEKTLVFYERASKAPLFEIQKKVSQQWELLGKELEKIGPDNTEALKKWKEIVVTAIKNDKDFSSNTDIIFEFYNAIQVCIENNICDKKSAHELMRESARIFFGNNCPYVAYIRFENKIKDYGAKAEVLAGYPCNVDIYKGLVQ